MDIYAVTFNMRLDVAGDGPQQFIHRADFMREKILAERPDIIGFQEVLPHMKDWLCENLTGYTVVGYGRGAKFDDESNCIAFRRDRFELFGMHQFWLSPTPYIPGSRYEHQSRCPRICTIAMLCERGGTRPFRVYNTHLDHVDDEARVLGITAVLDRITEDNREYRCPIILMGDLNAKPSSLPIRKLSEYEAFPLCDITAEIPGSFHDYGRCKPEKIDYIYTDRGNAVSRVEAWCDRRGELYLSDHYPIGAHIEL